MDSVEISFDRPDRIWGRAVANHGFLKALVTGSKRPEVTVFVPTRKDVPRLQETLLAGSREAVAVVALMDIPSYLAEHPLDVLHVPGPTLWTAAHIRNFLSEKPFVITGVTHSLGNDHFLGWALQNSANGISGADCLVCTTQTAQSVVESAFARLAASQPGFRAPATTVIPLGITPLPPAQPAGMSRRELGLGDDDFVVLSFGRFNHQFKMDVLPLLNLAAMASARATRPLRLLLAGSADNGAYAALVEDQARAQGLGATVRVLPNIAEAQKNGLFRAADVFMSLSDNVQETFGLSVVEALAAGIPVVASDWNGYRGLVQPGVTGFLVPTRTLGASEHWEARLACQPDALAHLYCAQATAVDLQVACDCLLRLSADRNLARTMGAAAAASAAPYEWDAVIQDYLALWARLSAAAAAAADRGTGRSSALAFLADFSAYSSSTLSPRDRFATSELGRLVMERKKSLYLYEHMEPVLDLNIMTRVLQLFTVENALGDITRELGLEQGRDLLRLNQNVLWLYKYGFLEARAAADAGQQGS